MTETLTYDQALAGELPDGWTAERHAFFHENATLVLACPVPMLDGCVLRPGQQLVVDYLEGEPHAYNVAPITAAAASDDDDEPAATKAPAKKAAPRKKG